MSECTDFCFDDDRRNKPPLEKLKRDVLTQISSYNDCNNTEQQFLKDISLFLQFYETEHVREERGKKTKRFV